VFFLPLCSITLGDYKRRGEKKKQRSAGGARAQEAAAAGGRRGRSQGGKLTSESRSARVVEVRREATEDRAVPDLRWPPPAPLRRLLSLVAGVAAAGAADKDPES
jgi:hypothetical protein